MSVWFGIEVALQAAKLVPVSERRRLVRQAENAARRLAGWPELEVEGLEGDEEENAEAYADATIADDIGPERQRRRSL